MDGAVNVDSLHFIAPSSIVFRTTTGRQNMGNEHSSRQVFVSDNHPVSMQKLATFVILAAMSPVLLILVVVSTTYLLRILLAISGILE